MKDFISAKTIADVVDVMKRPSPQIHVITIDEENSGGGGGGVKSDDFDEKFSFEPLSEEDIPSVAIFLKNDSPAHVQLHPGEVIKYWKSVLDSVQLLGMWYGKEKTVVEDA
jgi:hypothetical protein